MAGASSRAAHRRHRRTVGPTRPPSVPRFLGTEKPRNLADPGRRKPNHGRASRPQNVGDAPMWTGRTEPDRPVTCREAPDRGCNTLRTDRVEPRGRDWFRHALRRNQNLETKFRARCRLLPPEPNRVGDAAADSHRVIHTQATRKCEHRAPARPRLRRRRDITRPAISRTTSTTIPAQSPPTMAIATLWSTAAPPSPCTSDPGPAGRCRCPRRRSWAQLSP